jgi:murein DD-endopeptidase MepM/ murein hydrolase activator NlpD
LLKALLAFVLGAVAGGWAVYAWRPPTAPAHVATASPAPATAPREAPQTIPTAPIVPPAASPSPGEPEAPPATITPHQAPAESGPPVADEPMAPPAVGVSDLDYLAQRRIVVPVAGVALRNVRDTFAEMRGSRVHEAVDILAPLGTPVHAVDDGVVRKLFDSRQGGLTIYQYDPGERYSYYYAHLDRYADGVVEGRVLRKGDLVGYVGTTGNAPKDAPHLHFAVFRLEPSKEWWKGTAVNPYPVWALLERPPRAD